jgi:hypothetical protein
MNKIDIADSYPPKFALNQPTETILLASTVFTNYPYPIDRNAYRRIEMNKLNAVTLSSVTFTCEDPYRAQAYTLTTATGVNRITNMSRVGTTVTAAFTDYDNTHSSSYLTIVSQSDYTWPLVP